MTYLVTLGVPEGPVLWGNQRQHTVKLAVFELLDLYFNSFKVALPASTMKPVSLGA